MAEGAEAGEESGTRVIARAAAVMRTLESRSDGLNLSRIARETGLPRTTVSRLVAALVDERFLVVDGTGRVRLGPALARLAEAARRDPIAALRPSVEALAARTGETVHVWTLAERHVVLVDQIIGTREVRVALPIGTRLPLGCSSAGKAILAELPEEEARNLTDGTFAPHTPASPPSLAAIADQLAETRRTGLAFDIEEHADDVSAVGTALPPSPDGERFAVSIVAPARRFAERRTELANALGAVLPEQFRIRRDVF